MRNSEKSFPKYYSVQGLGQESCATAVSNGSVSWVVLKEHSLALESIGHRLVGLDIGLTSIDNTDEPKLQRVSSPRKDTQSIRSCIHEIQFCQNSDRALCLRVDLTSELKTVRVGEVNIGWRNRQNDTTRK